MSPDSNELEWKFIRAAGPGGQHVNKTSSAVQLRFLLDKNRTLNERAKDRLRRLAGHRLNDDGSILIAARSARSQEQNRRAAYARLLSLIEAALKEPKIRKKTKVSRAAKERRIEGKKHRAGTKKNRSKASWEN